MGGDEPFPDLVIRIENAASRRARAGAVLSLSDLLRLAANAEDMLLDVDVPLPAPADPDASEGFDAAEIRSAPAAEVDLESGGGGPAVIDAAAAPRLLQLGVKLLPQPELLGTSFLLAFSPRVVILNRTGRPLLTCQRGCTSFATRICEDDEWMPVHWVDRTKPLELLLCRQDRGAEWSGGIPLTAAAAAAAPMAGGTETTLRLRNLETGAMEFVRLSWHRLASRATSGLIISTDSSELAAPMVIHNLTRHTLHIKQIGVPIVSTLLAGDALPYAWDEPAKRLHLLLSVPALAVRFRTDGMPCRVRRPWLAALFGRACVELHVTTEGATTRIVLRDTSSSSLTRGSIQPLQPPRPMSPPLSPPNDAPRSSLSLGRPTKPLPPSTLLPPDEPLWQIQLQLADMGWTLLDADARELLYLSLRGMRAGLVRRLHRSSSSHAAKSVPLDTLSLALASVQLDCQLPRAAAREEVLLQIGVAARGDAVSAQLALTHDEGDEALAVLQRAVVSLQEITLRLDEEALEAVAAAMQGVMDVPAVGSHDDATSAAGAISSAHPQNARRWGDAAPAVSLGIHAELAQLRAKQLLVVAQRLFVQQLRVGAIPLKLSLQRASRPDATAPDGGAGDASQLRWLRWLGITLIGLDDVPLVLPEVGMHRALLPAGGLAQEVGQQYARALIQQAYKVLPSAALLGDPYGMLRTLRQRWDKHRLVMRHAAWVHMPALSLAAGADLLRAGAASCLWASGKSSRALSSGIEALLFEHFLTERELSLHEAALRGVGGLAREAARTIELVLHRVSDMPHPLPQPLDAVLAVVLLPYGIGKGIQRLILLITLASLSLMRQTAEACRTLLGSPLLKAETGRARAPRPAGALPLYPMCAASAHAGGAPPYLPYKATSPMESSVGEATTDGRLVCAMLAAPHGSVLLLTPSTIRCASPTASAPPLWEIHLSKLLLVQQRASRIELLVLANHAAAGAIEHHTLELHAEDDAARLHEVLRLAGLNARGAAHPAMSPRPEVRSTIFELLG